MPRWFEAAGAIRPRHGDGHHFLMPFCPLYLSGAANPLYSALPGRTAPPGSEGRLAAPPSKSPGLAGTSPLASADTREGPSPSPRAESPGSCPSPLAARRPRPPQVARPRRAPDQVSPRSRSTARRTACRFSGGTAPGSNVHPGPIRIGRPAACRTASATCPTQSSGVP